MHQTFTKDFPLLVQDEFYLIIHPFFVLSSFALYASFFVLFFHHRGSDERKWGFLHRNGAVYLRYSSWPSLFNN